MNEYDMTTGKQYKGKAYVCSSCNKRYYDNEEKKCPACGSKNRKLFQQTTANLNQNKES